ncbi:hypothetical protein V8C37DRAFT_37669 [Trichoderma ceciliae]
MAIQSERDAEMARHTMGFTTGSMLRSSIEQLDGITKRLMTRCIDTQDNNTCEKPISQSHIILAVILTTAFLLVGSALLVLLWLHLRRRQIDKLEDSSDPFELAAYGIEPPPPQKKRRRDRLRQMMGR